MCLTPAGALFCGCMELCSATFDVVWAGIFLPSACSCLSLHGYCRESMTDRTLVVLPEVPVHNESFVSPARCCFQRCSSRKAVMFRFAIIVRRCTITCAMGLFVSWLRFVLLWLCNDISTPREKPQFDGLFSLFGWGLP